LSKGGVSYHGSTLPIRLKCFITDAPARAFILNHRNYTSNRPCSKCKISGTRCEGRYIFRGVIHSLHTDEEYTTVLDEDHHKDGKSPLSMLPIGMVSQVPFEHASRMSGRYEKVVICMGIRKIFKIFKIVCKSYYRYRHSIGDICSLLSIRFCKTS